MKNKRTTSRARSTKNFVTKDSFSNLMTRTGVGAGNGNISGAGRYDFTPVSRNRVNLEWAYRSSWICGKAVDLPAEDMTRAGIELHTDLSPDDITTLERAAKALTIWDDIADTIRWARLYGGAIAVLMIDGQNTETPLNLDSIGQDSFRGLMVLDRWCVVPDLQNLVQDYGPRYGEPEYYQVVQDALGLPKMRVHYSRCIRIEGQRLPHWQRISENLWGQSVIERLYDRLLAFDSTTQGAAQMVHKAHLRTYKIEGLREVIAAGGELFEGLLKQIEMIRAFQTNEGLTLMDKSDEFEAHQYTFSGLSDIMLQFSQQLAGAIDIPLVRLFNQSPAGLNATGDADIRNYYDNINTTQNRMLRGPLLTIFNVLHRSVLGREPDENFDFEFRPLWQLTDQERGTIGTQITTAVVGAYGAGLIMRATALRELKQCAKVTNMWTNITDDDIDDAEKLDNEMPPGINQALAIAAESQGGDPSGSAAASEVDTMTGNSQNAMTKLKLKTRAKGLGA